MTVQDILTLVKFKMRNFAISKDEDALITLINMGVSELYKRFNLAIKSETVNCNENLALYELRNDDVLLILTIFDKFGKELQQTDVLDGIKYDYKLVNYHSFILRKPFNGYLYVVYKASNIPLKDKEDKIDIPDAMVEALLFYVCCIGVSTVIRDQNQLGDLGFYQQMLARAYQDLENQGYKIPLNTEMLALHAKGFV